MKKRMVVTLCVLLCTMLFAACGSSVELYVYTDGDDVVYEIGVCLQKSEVARLEATAKDSGVRRAGLNPFPQHIMSDGEWVSGDGVWTIEQYLRVLSMIRDTDGFSYVKTDATVAAGYRVMVFRKIMESSKEDERVKEFTRLSASNPFFYTIEVSYPNPFKGWRESYDAALASPASDTFFGLFLHGDPSVKMPAFFEAFPVLEYDQNPNNLETRYIIETMSRLFVKSPAVKNEDVSGYNFYVYENAFTTNAQNISYTYYRPNATGWLIVAIVGGFVAVGVVWLMLEYRKRNPAKVVVRLDANQNRLPPSQNPYNPYNPYPLDPFAPPQDSLNPFEDFDDKPDDKHGES